jgi:hypothetical protein
MAIRWAELQSIYIADAPAHWTRARELGLECPFDVFEQLFFDQHGDEEFATIVQPLDWQSVEWQAIELSGAALRRVAVPRSYQRALDEARWRTAQLGLQDERSGVLEHWRREHSWMRSPILIAGSVLGSALGTECLVGVTRLGNLLGLMDREQISEQALHRVWSGAAIRSDQRV